MGKIDFKFREEVLVRDSINDKWIPANFAYYDVELDSYFILGGLDWEQCIPFQGNEKLLDTFMS